MRLQMRDWKQAIERLATFPSKHEETVRQWRMYYDMMNLHSSQREARLRKRFGYY